MKNSIEMLEQILNGEKALTPKNVAFVEIVNKLVGDIRKIDGYKSARGFIFNDKGEVTTENSVDVMEYGYNLKLVTAKDSEIIDIDAFLASIGLTQKQVKEMGFVKTRKGSDSVRVDKK